MVDALVDLLVEWNPQDEAAVRERAAAFQRELAALDAEMLAALEPLRGAEVVEFHHSMDYLLRRCGIRVAGAIEPSPGQSVGPRTLHELTEHAREHGARAVFMEPQLAGQAAEALAREAGIPLITVDPYGGAPGRETYADWLRWNLDAIRKAAP